MNLKLIREVYLEGTIPATLASGFPPAHHEENKSMHDPTLTMVERYLTLRLACSGPREEKVRALRRRKSGSAVLKNYSMSCEAKQGPKTLVRALPRR